MVMKSTNAYKRLILYYISYRISYHITYLISYLIYIIYQICISHHIIINVERLLRVSANLVVILWACVNFCCYSLNKNGRNV